MQVESGSEAQVYSENDVIFIIDTGSVICGGGTTTEETGERGCMMWSTWLKADAAVFSGLSATTSVA